MDLLYCLRPTFEPKATDNIEAMIDLIEKMISNKHAYAVDGDVYFDVRSI